MNEVATMDNTSVSVPGSEPVRRADPVSHGTLEVVLGSGDLSKLSSQQRVEYMLRTCESLGINPLTRPFRFLTLNSQVTMYATRDCADQLRATRRISLSLSEPRIEKGVLSVIAKARTPDGREDQDVGAVPFPDNVQGEARANLLMKVVTKSKRRVTMSICGLGFMDESEVETLPGARTFDADVPPEPQCISGEKCREIQNLMLDTRANEQQFLAYFGVSDVTEMDEARYVKAKNMLETKKREQAKAKEPEPAQ